MIPLILNLTAENIYSLPNNSLDIHGGVVFTGDAGVNGDLVMQPAAAVKVRNIDLVDFETYVEVGGDLYIDLGKTIFADSMTPHIHLGEPLSTTQTTYILKT